MLNSDVVTRLRHWNRPVWQSGYSVLDALIRPASYLVVAIVAFLTVLFFVWGPAGLDDLWLLPVLFVYLFIPAYLFNTTLLLASRFLSYLRSLPKHPSVNPSGSWWGVPLLTSISSIVWPVGLAILIVSTMFVDVVVFVLATGATAVFGVGYEHPDPFSPISLVLVVIVIYALTILSLIKDAQTIEDVGSPWVPDDNIWVVLSILITPVFASILYSLRRYQQIGIPWRSRFGGVKQRLVSLAT